MMGFHQRNIRDGITVLGSITPYKNRTVGCDLHKTKVYRNLNRKGVVYSLVQDGLVVGHGCDFVIHNPVFKVSAAGRDRTRKEQSRNVHAGVIGNLSEQLVAHTYYKLKYNPYEDDGFKAVGRKGELADLTNVETLYFTTKGVYCSVNNRNND